MNLYTVAQMREAEQRAVSEYGISLATLMNKAGHALAMTAMELLPDGGSVTIFCGKGNNGGDGYVCASELLKRNVPVMVWRIGRDELPSDSLADMAARKYEALGGVVRPFTQETTVDTVEGSLLIDALFGTGLIRPLTGVYAHAVEVINASDRPVLSCDLPSGVDGDTGTVLGSAVNATRTLMLGLAKLGCVHEPGRMYFGKLLVADIGLPEALVRSIPAAGYSNGIAEVCHMDLLKRMI